MKKFLILLSTLSLFAIACNKESINQNTLPKEKTEVKLISDTTMGLIDLSLNDDFVKMTNYEEEVHAIFRNLNFSTDDFDQLINDISNHGSTEIDVISTLNSYGLNGALIMNLWHLQSST